MNTPLSLSPLIPALIGAGAYSQDAHDAEHRAQLPQQVLADVRRARVELYCDHDAQALQCIRAALSVLVNSPDPVSPELVGSLVRAAWLARMGHYVDAEAALDVVLVGMESSSTDMH